VINAGNDHIFAYVRTHAAGGEGRTRVLVLANFSEHTQPLRANELRLYGLGYRFRELVSGKEIVLGDEPM
jgi:amylosucrase